MAINVRVTFRNVPSARALEAIALGCVDDLVDLWPRLTSCDVVIDAPHKHSRHGRAFRVEVRLAGPNLQLAVGASAKHTASDPYHAMHEAFRAARRSLVDHIHGWRSRDRSTIRRPSRGQRVAV
jgi:hypothetical protein